MMVALLGAIGGGIGGGCAAGPADAEIVRPDPPAALSAYARARVAWLRGERERSVALLQEAARLDPEAATVHAQLGRAFLLTGANELARGELVLAQRLDPTGIAGAVDLAELDTRESRSSQAADLLLHVVTQVPDHTTALHRLHPLLLFLGRIETGLATFERATALRPELSFLHEARADFLSCLGREAEALAGYRRALALDPEAQGAERKAARLLEEMGDRILRSIHAGSAEPAGPAAAAAGDGVGEPAAKDPPRDPR